MEYYPSGSNGYEVVPASSTPWSLGTALPAEIQRCQELLSEYKAIGVSGLFAAEMIKREIDDALKAMMEQDLPAMIRSYEKLKVCS